MSLANTNPQACPALAGLARLPRTAELHAPPGVIPSALVVPDSRTRRWAAERVTQRHKLVARLRVGVMR